MYIDERAVLLCIYMSSNNDIYIYRNFQVRTGPYEKCNLYIHTCVCIYIYTFCTKIKQVRDRGFSGEFRPFGKYFSCFWNNIYLYISWLLPAKVRIFLGSVPELLLLRRKKEKHAHQYLNHLLPSLFFEKYLWFHPKISVEKKYSQRSWISCFDGIYRKKIVAKDTIIVDKFNRCR